MVKQGGTQIRTLTYESIERRLSETIATIHSELDIRLIEGELDEKVIIRLSAERSAIKRVLKIIEYMTKGAEENDEEHE